MSPPLIASRTRLAGAAALVFLALIAGSFFWGDEIHNWWLGDASAERHAIQALTALRALTEAGTSYDQYVARLADVQVEVEPALRALADQGTSAARPSLELALKYYLAAGLAWQAARTSRESTWVALAQRFPRDPEFSMCPAARFVFAQAEMQRRHEETLSLDAFNAAPFWTCAADQLARGERLAR